MHLDVDAWPAYVVVDRRRQGEQERGWLAPIRRIRLGDGDEKVGT